MSHHPLIIGFFAAATLLCAIVVMCACSAADRKGDPMRRATKGLKPGQICPQSGQYRNSHTREQCTSVKGERLPPGPKGSRWVLTDATRHASES